MVTYTILLAIASLSLLIQDDIVVAKRFIQKTIYNNNVSKSLQNDVVISQPITSTISVETTTNKEDKIDELDIENFSLLSAPLFCPPGFLPDSRGNCRKIIK